jgi:hypothetical protein
MSYTIITNPITSITSTTATSGGNSIIGSGTVAFRGICWNTTGNPTTANSTNSVSGNSTANYSLNLTSLSAGSTYYVRAYISDSSTNVYYGNQISFTTPSLITTAASSITATTAISGGTFTGIVGTINTVGVCWGISTDPDPDINDSKTTDIPTGGVFTSIISGLLPNTTYKIRCYVNTISGVSYGDVKTFTTTSTLPTVTTSPTVSSIAATSFAASGNVTASGGATVSARGIQRSLDVSMSSPTNVTIGSGTGTFTGTVGSLTAGTTYYFRAFATNSNGTSYGQIYSTATLGGPIVQTIPSYSIKTSTAVTGCNVLSDGGTAITARGVCYSSVQTLPSISNSTVINDLYFAQTEPFITFLQNLDKDTTYYVRAFATNSVSTIYGNVEVFSTAICDSYVEDCNPEDSFVECADPVCAYNIPFGCAVYTGENITCQNTEGFFSDSSVTNLTNENTSAIQIIENINTALCSVFSKQYMIDMLNTIKNTQSLNSQFCNITCNCETICL